jgi:hypothetical protein
MSEPVADEKRPSHPQHHRSRSTAEAGGMSKELSDVAAAGASLEQHHRSNSTGSFFVGTATAGSATATAATTTESIVRRVEEEIVSARKASQLAKSRIGTYASSFPAGIGGISTSASAENLATSPSSTAAAGALSPAAADQSSMTTASAASPSSKSAAAAAISSDARRMAMMLTVSAVPSAESSSSASAHKSLSMISSKTGSQQRKSGSHDDEEYEPSFDLMEDILNIQETDSELLLHNKSKDSEADRTRSSTPPQPTMEADEDDDDAHFQHAMDVIGEEFETPKAATTTGYSSAAAHDTNAKQELEQPHLHQYAPSSSSLSKEPPGSFYDDEEDELTRQPRQVRSVGTGGSSHSGSVGASTGRSTTSSDRVVMEALSNGETAGQRARAILDTLKSRREHFSSTFRGGSGPGSARSSPEVVQVPAPNTTAALSPPSHLHAAARRNNDSSSSVADEKKDDDASTMSPAGSVSPREGTAEKATKSSSSNTLTVNTAAATTPTAQSSSTPTPSAMKRVSLPAPDRKKFKSRSKQGKGGATTPSPAQASTTMALAGNDLVKTPSPTQGSRRKTPLSKPAPSPPSSSPTADTIAAASSSTSRRIRFRDPFPVLKPSSRPRDPLAMIASHVVPPPVPITHWLRPKNDLRQLIVAVMGASIQRRAHACGALKVLTQTKKNQLMLMRTDSFLEALVFATSQDIPTKHGRGDIDEEEVENTNRYRSGDDAMLAVDARTRAVACLRNICEPKDNRGHVILHPGFKETLMYVIQDNPLENSPTAAGSGGDEARVIACGAFALLAKSPECRETFVSTPGLVDLLSHVMAGNIGNRTNEKDVSAVALPDVNVSRTGTLSQNTSMLSKQSSMSGRGGDHDHEDEDDDDEEDEDEEEHSDASDDDHSHDSSHTSEYTSQPSDSEIEEDDESSNARVSPKPSRRKDHSRGHRPSSRRHRGSSAKIDLDSSLPAEADELAPMSSIRQINHELHAEYLQRARSNACAALLHLSKHCAISVRLSASVALPSIGCTCIGSERSVSQLLPFIPPLFRAESIVQQQVPDREPDGCHARARQSDSHQVP